MVRDFNNPTVLELWRYYTYEVKNGNITSRKEYTTAGFSNEMTFTYTSDTNVFRPLCMFNVAGMLALEDVTSDTWMVSY